ncbi:hypothetical protein HD553DRAFT_321378 [Filobasidium floriforme]|uniref:uncharacterized protein n=1 Tax=Filobasidium floriforme TaxID=5210 RepID=UPI001E8D7513|nr:uncharacterized protein HD553DRAFT_321378 [Filobasidium floriforme]KAH8090777.1 hypothetical protein HD553DRAFT_321378 [Filobasidium floriforme]
MNDSIKTTVPSLSGTQRPQSQSGSYGPQDRMAADFLKEATDLWTTYSYMSSSEDATDKELNEIFRKFDYNYTKGIRHKQLEEGSVDTSGPLTVYAKADYRLKARRIFHAYRLESPPPPIFEPNAGLNLLSAQLWQYAEYFERYLLEDDEKCKNRLMEAILSVPDEKLSISPSISPEVFIELLDLLEANEIHAGDPKEKEEKEEKEEKTLPEGEA